MAEYNYKAIAYQSQGCTLETPFKKKLKKAWNNIILVIVVIACIAISATISGWIHLEQGHKQGVKDAYYEKNKVKGKISYAGASGDGRIIDNASR